MKGKTEAEVRFAVSSGAVLVAAFKEFKLEEVVEEPTPEVFDSGLLVNGGFADVVEGYTGNYNAGTDGKAAAWQ